MIYLDYNATTPIAPEVRQAMVQFLDAYGNPSSHHGLGQIAQQAVQQSRQRLAAALAVEPDEVVFTGGGTESNNLALKGVFLRGSGQPTGHLVITALEHPAVTAPARFLERMGVAVSIVPSDRDGVVEVESVRRALRPDTRLVSVMHANNEIGTIQPVREIAQLCRQRGVLVHTDAAQTFGKKAVGPEQLGVDLLSIAGHKLYAPKGVGALWVRRGVALEPLLHGAGHEGGRRAGTENIPYMVALAEAAQQAIDQLDQHARRMRALRDRLLEQLRGGMTEYLTVHGERVERLPNTLSVSFPGVSGYELLRHIPQLCASTGSACHSGQDAAPTGTLAAIGCSAEQARGTVRLSVGRYTTEAEVEQAAALLLDAWCKLRRQSAGTR